MKVFLSNRLEILADALRNRLFFSDLLPFEKKTVLVPSLSAKNYLLFRWANDPRLRVATGVKIETLSSFLELPSRSELSLQIETILREEKSGAIFDYLKSGSEKRLFSLSDELGVLFYRYLLFGGEEWERKEGWQREIWKKIKPSISKTVEGKTFLFHFSFLPRSIATLLEEAEGYFLSPSQMYWGDIVSEREKEFLKQKIQGVEETFEGQNSLLGNWGKMGRKFLTFLEGEERYEEPEGDSFLENLQKEILSLEEREKEIDDSIQIHSAASKMQEVKALRETIIRLRIPSNRIVVFAPDIAQYAPYIHAVFQEGPDYAISDLQLKEESLLAKGIDLLLNLPEADFSIETITQLFSFGNFLDKFRLTFEEGHRICTWVKKVHLRYGFQGLHRLLFALITIPDEGDLFLDFTDVPLLAKAVEIFQLLMQKLDVREEKTVGQWMKWMSEMAETFFQLKAEDEMMMREFLQWKRVEDLSFSFGSMRRVFQSILEKRSGAFQAGALHAIRFASLCPGVATPADTICLLGMDDDAFPRREKKTSLCEMEGDWAPSSSDEDRYLFLELFLSARRHFLLFYTKSDAEDGKEKEPSALLQDLKIPIQDHPPRVYALPEKRETLFSFALGDKREENLSIPIRSLKDFARHPLRFYFEKKEGLSFEKEENREAEFILSHLDLFWFRKQSLHKSVDEIIDRAEKKGQLPEGAFSDLAKDKIRSEVEQYRASLAELGVDKLETLDIDIHIPMPDGRSAHLYGKLEDVTKEGLLVHGEGKIEDWVKIWPLYLIYLQVEKGGKVLFSKSQEVKESFFENPLESLQRYLDFFERAKPSPFMPAWARPFLHKDSTALQKAIDSFFFPDPVVEYLAASSLLPPAEKLHDEWSPFLKEVFREIV